MIACERKRALERDSEHLKSARYFPTRDNLPDIQNYKYYRTGIIIQF